MSKGLPLGNQITIGGLVNIAELRMLAAEGVCAIVNLIPSGENPAAMPAAEEAQAVRALGMEYLHVEVPSGAPLSPERAREFVDGMARLPRPVHVYCQSGRRAGIYAAITLGIERGLSGEATLLHVKQLGFNPGTAEIADFIKTRIDAR